MPLSLNLSANFLKSIRLIASDMDGTLTKRGKFTPALLETLTQLAAAEITVVVVTGRSAGWVNGLVSYLPIAGAIAENGGIYYSAGDAYPEPLVTIPNLIAHRQKLAQAFSMLQADFPQLQESTDNRFRLTDWTFDIQGLTPAAVADLGDRCRDWGWGFTYSTVQCHIKLSQQNKASGLLQVLATHFPEDALTEVVTVGDSPNDESLFDGDRFSNSIGVANVLHYTDQLTHQPAYVTKSAEVDGFCELAQLLIHRRAQG